MGSYTLTHSQHFTEADAAANDTARLRRPVRASRAPVIVIASAVGLIAFLALMLLLAGLTLTGCASSPEARRLAHELRAQIAVNRAVSDPKPGVDPAKWARGQDAAAAAAASLEKEVQ